MTAIITFIPQNMMPKFIKADIDARNNAAPKRFKKLAFREDNEY